MRVVYVCFTARTENKYEDPPSVCWGPGLPQPARRQRLLRLQRLGARALQRRRGLGLPPQKLEC